MEADVRWGKSRENCQNLSAPILTSYFAVVYIKCFFLFSVLCLNLEYPDELWRCLSCFDTCIIFNTCWQTTWRTKTCIHIRRVRQFTYQLTVWYLQKRSFFLMYFMIRRLHKNEQNLENRGCVENGCVTSDVRTILGFVHVTLLNAQLWGLTCITCTDRNV